MQVLVRTLEPHIISLLQFQQEIRLYLSMQPNMLITSAP